jgi:tRNA threonylcarbamoyladenosine biosynthesis protein TsaB
LSCLLAIDSATDALSLALLDHRGIRSLHRVAPRQHQQLLFAMLDELLDGEPPAALQLDAIVYGRGPGSFTGLRIAVSAAQGLAFSLSVPVIGVSSLETQVRTFLRQQAITEPCHILSTLDARIGQLYAQQFLFDGTEPVACSEAIVAPPEAIAINAEQGAGALVGIGSGLELLSEGMPVAGALVQRWPTVLPEARDMLDPALQRFADKQLEQPMDAAPDYVQKRIGWKKLAEQGPRR